MAIARADETDLLLPLHDGMHEAAPWAVFLRRLRQRVRADGVALTVQPAVGAEQWFVAGQVTDDRAWRVRLRPQRVYAAEAGFGRTIRADAAEGTRGWLSIARAGRDFSAADGALLAGLAPHLAVALRGWEALERGRLTHEAAEMAVRRAGLGWVAFDGDGRVLAASAGAVEVGAARLATTRGTIAPGLVMLREAPPLPMLVVPVAARAIAALGLVDLGVAGDPALRPAVLAGLFGLAPAEARLAAALAGGATIAEAAAALGLTLETARNYSKRVFAKSRTRGQADLMRAIAGSLARLV
mgnify:CR=1 FL=1